MWKIILTADKMHRTVMVEKCLMIKELVISSVAIYNDIYELLGDITPENFEGSSSIAQSLCQSWREPIGLTNGNTKVCVILAFY